LEDEGPTAAGSTLSISEIFEDSLFLSVFSVHPSPSFWLKMATTTMLDLSEDQIDRLLAEAESRLAARAPGKAALVPHQSSVLATEPAPAVPDTATTTVQDQQKVAKELSVRVPKPVVKEKKVRYISLRDLHPCRPS
jgi:hypothetical protein